MARRKGFGNPFSKLLGDVVDKVVPEVVESVMDIASGPKKERDSSGPSSSSRSTDWATRTPAPPRTRKRQH